eukprot:1182750-Rhodomonas_salina.1
MGSVSRSYPLVCVRGREDSVLVAEQSIHDVSVRACQSGCCDCEHFSLPARHHGGQQEQHHIWYFLPLTPYAP